MERFGLWWRWWWIHLCILGWTSEGWIFKNLSHKQIGQSTLHVALVDSDISQKRRELEGLRNLHDAYTKNPSTGDADEIYEVGGGVVSEKLINAQVIGSFCLVNSHLRVLRMCCDLLRCSIHSWCAIKIALTWLFKQLEVLPATHPHSLTFSEDSEEQKRHDFQKSAFTIPTTCDCCLEKIWGLSTQGFICKGLFSPQFVDLVVRMWLQLSHQMRIESAAFLFPHQRRQEDRRQPQSSATSRYVGFYASSTNLCGSEPNPGLKKSVSSSIGSPAPQLASKSVGKAARRTSIHSESNHKVATRTAKYHCCDFILFKSFVWLQSHSRRWTEGARERHHHYNFNGRRIWLAQGISPPSLLPAYFYLGRNWGWDWTCANIVRGPPIFYAPRFRQATGYSRFVVACVRYHVSDSACLVRL